MSDFVHLPIQLVTIIECLVCEPTLINKSKKNYDRRTKTKKLECHKV